MIEDIFALTKTGIWDWFYSSEYDLYYLDPCDSIPDDLPILTFWLGGIELKYGPSNYMTKDDDKCYLTFARASDNTTMDWILGQDFLSSNRVIFNYNNSTVAFAVPIPENPDDGSQGGGGLGTGAIIGIAAGGLVALIAAIVISKRCCASKKQRL